MDIHNRTVSFFTQLVSFKQHIFRPTDSGFESQLAALSRIGARVQAIGLGNVTGDYLNMFGYNSIVSHNYNNPLYGIANVQNNQLSTYLYQTSTGTGLYFAQHFR
jgi:hypothetical protein